jgi:hypothetical protein
MRKRTDNFFVWMFSINPVYRDVAMIVVVHDNVYGHVYVVDSKYKGSSHRVPSYEIFEPDSGSSKDVQCAVVMAWRAGETGAHTRRPKKRGGSEMHYLPAKGQVDLAV